MIVIAKVTSSWECNAFHYVELPALQAGIHLVLARAAEEEEDRSRLRTEDSYSKNTHSSLLL